MNPGLNTDIRHEAEYFYRCMFGGTAPQELVNNYLLAHEKISGLINAPSDQLKSIHIILLKRLDAVSIEPWLRTRKVRHPLSSKLLLISYLAEADGTHREYVSFPNGLVHCWFSLTTLGFSLFFGLIKGRILKEWYGLV